MHHVLVAVLGAATPTPTTPVSPDPDLVTPGVVGFLATAFVAVAVILLVWDMTRRIRRGRVRADLQEQLDAEEQARARGTGDIRVETTDEDEPGDGPARR
jgi:capsular polysaccharide biosynthesis protein